MQVHYPPGLEMLLDGKRVEILGRFDLPTIYGWRYWVRNDRGETVACNEAMLEVIGVMPLDPR